MKHLFLLLLASLIGSACLSQRASIIPYRQGDKWGFCDRDMKILIPCQYLDARPFTEGLAAVRTEKGWGWINEKAAWVMPPQYDVLYPLNKNGMAIVVKSGKEGVVNRQGRELVPCMYKSVSFSGPYIMTETTDSKYAVRNAANKELITPVDYYLTPLRNSRLRVREGRLWGFRDPAGKMVIPPQFDETGLYFNEGMIAVRKGSLWGYIDSMGRMVVQPAFEAAEFFNQGRAAVKQNGKWGYIDTQGNMVVPARFDQVRDFVEHEGKKRALVAEANGMLWQIIDEKGATIKRLNVLRPTDFKNGYLSGKGVKYMAVVDIDGKVVGQTDFESISNVVDGYYFGKKGDNYALCTLTTLVTKPRYAEMKFTQTDLIEVEYAGKKGYIDRLGIEYWKD